MSEEQTATRERTAVRHDPRYGPKGTHASYGRGDRCDDCLEAHRIAEREFRARDPQRRAAALTSQRSALALEAIASSAALDCKCGGLLAEESGRVFCLSCGI